MSGPRMRAGPVHPARRIGPQRAEQPGPDPLPIPDREEHDEQHQHQAAGALASITRTLADYLADRPITLNAVNPGPVDTGGYQPDVLDALRRHFPQGRWGNPDNPARLIAWLTTDEAAWFTGQIINTKAAPAASA